MFKFIVSFKSLLLSAIAARRERALIDSCFSEEDAERLWRRCHKMVIISIVLFSVGCYEVAEEPDPEPDVRAVAVRVANFHGAFLTLCVEGAGEDCQEVARGEIISMYVQDIGVLKVYGDKATYDLDIPILSDRDVLVIRDKSGGSRMTIDVVNADNREMNCAMYAQFEQPDLYGQLCPNIKMEVNQ